MKSSVGRVVITLLLLAAATAGAGSIYKWVDDNGVVHYSDRAPDETHVEGDVETREAVSGTPSPSVGTDETSAPAAADPPAPETRRPTPEIEIYTTSWCRYCRDAKNYFRTRGIPFKEYDIEKDSAAARRHKRYNPRGGVPVTVINGRPIVGYAPAAFARALQGP
jgi:glutaredoxin-like YruB-family protein